MRNWCLQLNAYDVMDALIRQPVSLRTLAPRVGVDRPGQGRNAAADLLEDGREAVIDRQRI
jgi:hypothetical protein